MLLARACSARAQLIRSSRLALFASRTSGSTACRGLHTTSRAFQTPDRQNDRNKQQPDQEDDEEFRRERRLFLTKFLVGNGIAVLIVLYFMRSHSDKDPGKREITEVSWNDFLHNMLLAGEVNRIVVFPKSRAAVILLKPDAIYKGHQVSSAKMFQLRMTDINEIEDRIRETERSLGIAPENGINITYERRNEYFYQIFLACLIVAVSWVMIRTIPSAFTMANPFKNITAANFTLVNPQIRRGQGIRFSDVAGLKEAKLEIKDFVDYLKFADRYKELGAKPPKGALLTGPPGCGKTLLAKAVANESNVPFLSTSGSEFMEMIGGLGAARVRNLFSEAKKMAPSIIYIDEIDAIGRKRSGGGDAGMSMGEAEQTLNQLLVELDGMSSREGIVILASTNRADVLDKALLRPGRFDRHILIDLPTLIERKEILEQHMKSVKLDAPPTTYSERLASLTPGFSGADLANLVNEATLHAARLNKKHVKAENLDYAIERVIAGPEKKTGSLNVLEKKVVAYHESGHALVGWLLEHTDALLKVTILPRTSHALGFAQYTPTNKKLFSPEEFMDRMCMALGGRVAESIIFNRITTGAQNDLEKVTNMAYAQIKHFGFNAVVGLVSFQDQGGMKRPYSKRLQSTMDHEARLLIAQAYQRTEALLIQHRQQLQLLAEALLQKETLNYEDVEMILGPSPFPKKNLISPTDFEIGLAQQADLGSQPQDTSTEG